MQWIQHMTAFDSRTKVLDLVNIFLNEICQDFKINSLNASKSGYN